jgi:hypothetical protein
MKSRAYNLGCKVAAEGHSIHFNPYRHKGTAQEYCDFEAGYLATLQKP